MTGNGASAPRCPQCGSELPYGAAYCHLCGTGIRHQTLESISGDTGARTSSQPVGVQTPPATVAALPHPLLYIERYTQSKREKNRKILGSFGAFVSLSLIMALIIYCVILIWSASIVIPEGWLYGADLFIIVPMIIRIGHVEGGWFAAYYIFLIAAIVLSFLWVLFSGWKTYSTELAMTWKEGEHSPIFTVAGLFFGIMFFDLVYIGILFLSGITPNTPPIGEKPLWAQIYSLANASVWEEIITRVLLLGIPLMAYDRIAQKQKKPIWRYLLGGNFDLKKPAGLNAEMVLVVFSSLMFAIAHVFSWDITKILPTFVAGIAFAYLFLKYGIAASIVLHFSFDFTSIPMNISEDLGIVIVSFMVLWVLIGVVFFVYYAYKLIEFLVGDSERGPQPVPAGSVMQQGGVIPPPSPPSPPSPPIVSEMAYPPGTPVQQQPYWQQWPPGPAAQIPPPAISPPYVQPPPPTSPVQTVVVQPPTYAPRYTAPERAEKTPEDRMQYPTIRGQNSTGKDPEHGFVCSRCGFTRAKYESGRLICMRCGHGEM